MATPKSVLVNCVTESVKSNSSLNLHYGFDDSSKDNGFVLAQKAPKGLQLQQKRKITDFGTVEKILVQKY